MNKLELEAESIVFLNLGSHGIPAEHLPGVMCKIILFRPSTESLDKIRNMKVGDTFSGATLEDVWDDDSADFNLSPKSFVFASRTASSLKGKTQVLNFFMR